jgi:uncharacterized membrane protein
MSTTTLLGGYGSAAAIAVMAAVTYALRAGGFWMMSHVPLTPLVRRMLDALPGAVVVATVLPIAVHEGLPAFVAIGVALAAMALTRRDLIAVVGGMGAAALLRALTL